MTNVNLWDSNFKDYFVFFDNTEDLFKYLDENNIDLHFKTKRGYKPGDYCEGKLDNAAFRENTHVVYTDDKHPIAISNLFGFYVSPDFFNANKVAFVSYAKKKFEEEINMGYCILIPEFIFDNDLLMRIINDKKLKNLDYVLLECTEEIKLTEEQITLLKENHIEFEVNHRFKDSESISARNIIDTYDVDKLKTIKYIDFNIPIADDKIDNFIYINEAAKITFNPSINSKKNELLFLQSIQNILKKLAKHNHKYNITFAVKNREILRQSNLLNSLPDNVNITIRNDLYDYDVKTFQKEDEKLEELAKPIRDSNLSPFEKYLAVYNIVKQFKPYKENENDKERARYLRYILDDNNEYIVCVGFASLLKELMDRVGISNYKLGVNIDVSYNGGYTMEEKSAVMVGHARNIIRIDDDKYNIHGYYVVDSTWDNVMENDRYLNSLMTFNRKKEAKRLESLTDEDLLLDFNDMDDFINKINYYFKKKLNSILSNQIFVTPEMKNINKIKEKYQLMIDSTNDNKEKRKYASIMNSELHEVYQKTCVRVYKEIYDKMLDILYHTDTEKYNYFYDKYYSQLNEYNLSLDKVEQLMNKLTREYANYIIPLTNKEVPLDTILQAARVVKKEIDGLNDEELAKWYQETKEANEQRRKISFPYKYNPEIKKEAYLEDYSESETINTR